MKSKEICGGRFWLTHDERGGETLEFALSFVLLGTVLFGILDLCRAMYSYQFVADAAQEGARYAAVRGADWPSANPCNSAAPPVFTLNFKCRASAGDVQNYVQSLATAGINAGKVTATTTWPGTTPSCSSGCTACAPTNSQGCIVRVKVNYTFSFSVPLMPAGGGLNFSATAQQVIQQ